MIDRQSAFFLILVIVIISALMFHSRQPDEPQELALSVVRGHGVRCVRLIDAESGRAASDWQCVHAIEMVESSQSEL